MQNSNLNKPCDIIFFFIDPCNNYVNLDDPERSVAYLRGDTSTSICDATITEQWYRSVSGAGPDMPTSHVPLGRCGTLYPIWVNDSKYNITFRRIDKLTIV